MIEVESFLQQLQDGHPDIYNIVPWAVVADFNAAQTLLMTRQPPDEDTPAPVLWWFTQMIG